MYKGTRYGVHAALVISSDVHDDVTAHDSCRATIKGLNLLKPASHMYRIVLGIPSDDYGQESTDIVREARDGGQYGNDHVDEPHVHVMSSLDSSPIQARTCTAACCMFYWQ